MTSTALPRAPLSPSTRPMLRRPPSGVTEPPGCIVPRARRAGEAHIVKVPHSGSSRRAPAASVVDPTPRRKSAAQRVALPRAPHTETACGQCPPESRRRAATSPRCMFTGQAAGVLGRAPPQTSCPGDVVEGILCVGREDRHAPREGGGEGGHVSLAASASADRGVRWSLHGNGLPAAYLQSTDPGKAIDRMPSCGVPTYPTTISKRPSSYQLDPGRRRPGGRV